MSSRHDSLQFIVKCIQGCDYIVFIIKKITLCYFCYAKIVYNCINANIFRLKYC